MAIEEYSLAQFIDNLRRITAKTTDNRSIINGVRPLAKRLALDKAWLQDTFYQAGSEQGSVCISSMRKKIILWLFLP